MPLVLLAAMLVSGCRGSAEEFFKRGVAAQDKGQLSEAISAYSNAIQTDPTFAMAHFNRGLAHLELEEFHDAVTDLSRALDLRGEDPDILLARGTALHAMRQHDKAVLDLTAALKLDQVNVEALRQRAFAWQALDESAAAIADLSMAIRLEPDRPGLYLDRAEVRRIRGDDAGMIVDQTLSEFTTKIVASNDTQTRRSRGQAFFFIAEYELALADLNKVLEDTSTDEIALLVRGQTLYVLGDLDGALADFTTVVDAQGRRVAEALASRAVLHENREEFAEAIHDYHQAIDASPDDKDLLARCAWLLATCGNSQFRDGRRAVEYAERACALTDWNDWFCLDAHAAASAEIQDFEWAVACQTRAVAVAPDGQLEPLEQRLEAYRKHQPYRANTTQTALHR